MNRSLAPIRQKIARVLAAVPVIITSVLGSQTLVSVVPAGIISPIAMETQTAQAPIGTPHEVFGFAPHWTLHRLGNVDFDTLTTLAYFGVPITADGSLDRDDIGYKKLRSAQAAELFTKARAHGVRIVLTITQMDNPTIKAFLSDSKAQERATAETITLVREMKLDGVNIDIEYVGNPGPAYRTAFSSFVSLLSSRMHSELIGSYISVSVYAASAKEQRLYDIGHIGNATDGIFMMAYDFATTSATNAQPTAPLFGHKEGKYWYDVATAVDDFLKVMPAEKLILGVPYYGYNYAVGEPKPDTTAYPRGWRGKSYAQTYAMAKRDIEVGKNGVTKVVDGWDDVAKVGWKSYKQGNVWRFVYIEDEESLSYKYDFVKQKKLGGVGIWALGFDTEHDELWQLLAAKFGEHVAFTAFKRMRG